MNFTSEVHHFSPYTPQSPVEAEALVGSQKQGELQAGIQKVQGYVDYLHGFDIAKDVTRDYIQNKIGSMKEQVGNVAGDFSDNRLVNQVGGLAGKIASDPVVQNGILSTAAYRKGLQDIQQSRKDKNYGVSNEWDFMDKSQKWLNDGDHTTSFSASYTPHTDIDKEIREGVAAAHFDSATWDELPKNPDGSPNSDALIEKSKKGLLSSKVQGIVNEVFSKPEIQQQLAIDGRYNYRNYTPQMLKEEQDKSLRYSLDKAQSQVIALNLTNQLSKSDREDANKSLISIQDNVKSLKDEYKKSVEQLQNIKSQEDLDNFKVGFHIGNEAQRYVGNYSWEENSAIMKANPASEMQLRRSEFDLNQRKFAFDMMDKTRDYQLKYLDELRKEEIAQGKINPDGTKSTTYVTGALDPSTIKTGKYAFDEETKSIDNQKNQLQAEIITHLTAPSGGPVQYSDMFVQDRDGKWQINYQKYKNWETIKPYYKAALQEIDKEHLNGTLSNNFKDKAAQLYDLSSNLMERHNFANKIEDKYKPDIDKAKASMGNINAPLNNVWTGEPTGKTVNSSDLVDSWLVDNNKPGKEEALQRLQSKFGKDYDSFQSQMKSSTSVYDPVGGSYNSKVGQLSYLRTQTDNILGKDPNVAGALTRREQEYTNLQGQQQYQIGQFNPKNEEERLKINSIYAQAVSNMMGDKTGDFKETARALEAGKTGDVKDNLYQFYKDNSGQYYLQVKTNQKGKYVTSQSIPISNEFVSQLPITKDLKQEQFDSTFGQFLKLNNWRSTTPSLNSPEAENTAIMRHQVGKYSVGFHLQELDGKYVPYVYVRDSKSGNILASGLELDISKFADDPSIAPELREQIASRQSAMSSDNVLDAINSVDEHFIDLLLKKK